MKRILNGNEITEHFDSQEESDNFYVELANGAMPTTTQLNPHELEEYFQKILDTEKDGDIIHVALSSGLSTTCENAIKVANDFNGKLKGRKIYVIDSLIATYGMALMVEELVELRNAGAKTTDAVKRVENLRDNMQGWIIMGDLHHLKRGGRIGGFQAMVGSILGIKPILTVNHKGKLVIENKMKGSHKAIQYILEKIETLGAKADSNFLKGTLYFVRTSPSKIYDDMKVAVLEKYPSLNVKEGIIGPIIGSHMGGSGIAVIFCGAKRLTIEEKK